MRKLILLNFLILAILTAVSIAESAKTMPQKRYFFEPVSEIFSDLSASGYQSEYKNENQASLYLEGFLDGNVLESNGGNPIEEAIVKVWQYSNEVARCTTDYQGHFFCTLNSGYYWLEASKEGYQTDFRYNIYIPPGWTRIVGFRLERTVGIDTEQSLPHTFQLNQNYPNPFNAKTTISFELPAASPVSLAIYDITGAKIATLLDSYLPADRYEITWDAANFSSGIYFYKLKTQAETRTRKAVIIK